MIKGIAKILWILAFTLCLALPCSASAGERQHLRIHTTLYRAVDLPWPVPEPNPDREENFHYELWLRRDQPANASPVFLWTQHNYNWLSSSIGCVPPCLDLATDTNWAAHDVDPGMWNEKMGNSIDQIKYRVEQIAN